MSLLRSPTHVQLSHTSIHMLFLLLVRSVLFSACLYLLPNVVFSPSSNAIGVLPTTAATVTHNLAAGKKDWRQMLARMVFSWTFTESSMLFILLVCQAMNTFSASQRAGNFQFSLYALLVIHIILIPQSIALLVLSPTPTNICRSAPRAVLSSFIPVILSFTLLSYIPSFTLESDPPFLSRTLSRLIALGTTILGLLSGFGAVTRAWNFLPSSLSKDCDTVLTEEEIRGTEVSLQSVWNDLQRKEDELASRDQASQSSSNIGGTSSNTAVWMKLVRDTLHGGDELTLQVRGLKTLHSTLSSILQSQRIKFASSQHAQTLKGRLSSCIGNLFAAYCIFRTITAGYNILFSHPLRPREMRSQTYPDIVTSILIWLLIPSPTLSDRVTDDSVNIHGVEGVREAKVILGFELTPEWISSLARHISLLLIGLIVLSSTGLVMRGVNRALKVTSQALGICLIILVLSYLMGIYLLSTVVQLRSSFPPPHARHDISADDVDAGVMLDTSTNLFNLIPPWELFSSWFDLVFFAAALVTAGVKWSVDRLGMVE
ncbi:hypothetical protein Ac2012v2_006020 [Leucoagaricus gongylophorus]